MANTKTRDKDRILNNYFGLMCICITYSTGAVTTVTTVTPVV